MVVLYEVPLKHVFALEHFSKYGCSTAVTSEDFSDDSPCRLIRASVPGLKYKICIVTSNKYCKCIRNITYNMLFPAFSAQPYSGYVEI